MPDHSHCADVVVIGGGPAGAAVSTFLHREGFRVIVLEKCRFPRYHIGESLVPYTWFPLQRLGVLDRLRQSDFVKKYSVQFVREDGRQSQPFYFDQHMQHEAAQTWQVTRPEFDQMLLDHARDSGVDVRQEHTVTDLLHDAAGTVTGVTATDAAGQTHTCHARLVIDASGRDGVTISRRRWRLMDPKLKKVAIWAYWRGALRDPGKDGGATTVAYVNGKDWFWYIPQQNDLISVGVVGSPETLYADSRDPAEIYRQHLAKNVWIAQHVAPGTQVGEVHVTGDYSYRSRHCAADGVVLVGDAFAFLDPVFSTGLMLALWSASMLADAATAALRANDVRADRFVEYGRKYCAGLETMRRFVYTFYDPNFSFRPFLTKYPHLKGDLTDCLIGRLDRDYDELWLRLGEFADLPASLPHGTPCPAASITA